MEGMISVRSAFILAINDLTDPYSNSIQERASEILGQRVSNGTVYTTLSRLEADGFIKSHWSAPLPERGGKSRRIYELTAEGAGTVDDIIDRVSAIQRLVWRQST